MLSGLGICIVHDTLSQHATSSQSLLELRKLCKFVNTSNAHEVVNSQVREWRRKLKTVGRYCSSKLLWVPEWHQNGYVNGWYQKYSHTFCRWTNCHLWCFDTVFDREIILKNYFGGEVCIFVASLALIKTWPNTPRNTFLRREGACC